MLLNLPVALLTVTLLLSATAAWADEFDRNKERCLESRFPAAERIESCTWLLNSGQIGTARGYSLALMARGTVYRSVGDLKRSLSDLSEAIGQDRDHSDAYAYRGATYLYMHDFDRCVADFDTFLRKQEGAYYHWIRRGQCHFGLKNIDNGREDILKADEICEASGRNDCQLPVALAIGQMAVTFRDFGNADELYRALVSEEPGNSRVINAVGWFLATVDDGRYRNGAEALRLARRALDLDKSSVAYDTLAAAHAEMDQFDDAVRSETEALRLIRARMPDSGSVRSYEKRLDAYRSRRPIRCPGDLCD